MSSFDLLEEKIDLDTTSRTQGYWVDFRVLINDLLRLQAETSKQLEGRWFLSCSYQEALGKASDLAEIAFKLARNLRDDCDTLSMDTPEFNALVDHAISLTDQLAKSPEILFRRSALSTYSKCDFTM